MSQASHALYSPLSQRPPQRAPVTAVVVVVVGGAAGALAALGIAAFLPGTLPTLPTVATSSAATAAVVLGVLARLTRDGRLRWVAWGYGVAAAVTLVAGFGVGVQEVTGGVLALTRTPDAGVAMAPLGHMALPAFAAVAVLRPSRRWLRVALAAGFAAAVAVSVVDPALLGLPTVVDAEQRFTAEYRWVAGGSAAVCLAGAVLWIVRTGRRPTWPELWVSVGVVLLGWGAVAHLLAAAPASSLWGAGHLLLVSSGVVPAVGLFAVLLNDVATLERREQALADRLNHELTDVLDVHVEAMRERRSLEQRFDRVQSLIDSQALSIVLQPICDLRDGHVLGYEALSRFDGPPAKPPHTWFHEAACVGSGVDLELAAVAAALPRLADLPRDAYLAVNVSPATLASPRLAALLDTVDVARVVVEVTEHAPIDDYARVSRALDRLRARGVRLAVDDAGAGFSSLRHIVRLGPAIVKLDMSLTRDIHRDPVRRSLAASLVSFAEENRIALVAEGIETEHELDELCALGVTAGQGYLLCRPGPFPATPASARMRRDGACR